MSHSEDWLGITDIPFTAYSLPTTDFLRKPSADETCTTSRSYAYAPDIATLTFLFTDIESSTSTLRRLGDERYARVLDAHNSLVTEGIVMHDGDIQGNTGDSFFAVFDSAKASVSAAVHIQRLLRDYSWPIDTAPRVRRGLHTGEATTAPTGLVGYQVHRAARIAAVGHGGQILLSSATTAIVEESIDDGIHFRDLGLHRLKDLGRPERLTQVVVADLPSEFPPVRSLSNPELANNLPTSLSPFVGRRREIGEIRRLIRDQRLVTLAGPGGAGKTRLALQVAAELLDGTGDGVWLVDLAPVIDPTQVPLTVLAALGIAPGDIATARDALLGILAGQNCLLVLDNCEHVLDEVAHLTESIMRFCPHVHLIMTSREPLGIDGEDVYRVRSLSTPSDDAETRLDLIGSDAVELFCQRARALDKSFELTDANAAIVASICRNLDGIPLAVELAAARLATLSIVDLHDRLDQRFRLLTGGRSAIPRHQTLGAMVEWSHHLLSPMEQAVLQRLSIFVGGFDLAAAEAVCTDSDLPVAAVADALSSLVNKSFVVAERSAIRLHYRLLETIRQYAAQRLAAPGNDSQLHDVREAHAHYFLELSRRARVGLYGPRQVEWLAHLDEAHENISAALAYLATEPDGDAAVLELIANLHLFVVTRGRLDWSLTLCETWRRDVVLPRVVEANALCCLGELQRLDLLPTEVLLRRDLVRRVLDVTRDCDDVFVLVNGLATAAYVAWESGSTSGAALADTALRVARESRDPCLEGLALLARSQVVGSSACERDPSLTLPEARTLLTEAAECFRRAGTPVFLSSVLLKLAVTDWQTLDDVSASREFLREASNLPDVVGPVQTSAMHLNYALALAITRNFPLAQSNLAIAFRAARHIPRHLNQQLGVFTFALSLIESQIGDAERAGLLMGALEHFRPADPPSSTLVWSPCEVEALRNARERLEQLIGSDTVSAQVIRGASLTETELVAHLRGALSGATH